jgi:adenylate cyclase
MSESRKLAAILGADVVGYSRLAGTDEERTLARPRSLRSVGQVLSNIPRVIR